MVLVTYSGDVLFITSKNFHSPWNYSATCCSTHTWLVSALHSVPSSCTLYQPELMASIFDKKYRFGVSFKVLAY